MAEFTEEFQSLIRPLSSSFPFLDVDPSMGVMSQLIGLNSTQHVMENSSPQNLMMMMPFSSSSSSCDDTFFGSQDQLGFPLNMEESFKGLVHHVNNNNNNNNAVPASLPIFEAENETHQGKKRKAISPAVSDSGSKIKNFQGCGRGKRVKSNVTEEVKPKEVVHVRARRGQATDSHSIAERVRRGKINEKLRCLQNIVPGCYKTMGMAVMLDEIINYVQSLQHQVEFLSLKLTAASTFYDFNSETDDLETMQRARASEAKELAKYEREGYGGVSCFQPTWHL